MLLSGREVRKWGAVLCGTLALATPARVALGEDFVATPAKAAAVAEAPPAAGEAFDFELHREGVPDRIRGRAQSVNFIAAVAQAGCRFLVLEDDGADRLRDWLVALVIMNASVRISEKDAAAIVAGPSLI